MKKKQLPGFYEVKDFERRVRLRLYQLKRSRLYAKKIQRELDSVNTPEQAKAYIKNAGMASVEEIKTKNEKKRV